MKALIIGATGATGKDLTELLLKDNRYSEVRILVRRGGVFPANGKFKEYVIDFDKLSEYEDAFSGADVAYCSLGTTLKDAGSKEKQKVIDVDYPLAFAKMAENHGVKQFVLVSANGANAKSPFFYMRLKGMLEDAVKQLNFQRIIIVQPNSLIRKNTNRAGENMGVKLMQTVNKIGLLKSFAPISTEKLACKMIELAAAPIDQRIVTVSGKELLN